MKSWLTLIFLTPLVLSGCAVLDLGSSPSDTINGHIQQKNFQLARTTLIANEKNLAEAQIVAWQTLIADEQRLFVNRVLVQAKTHWRKKAYGRAFRLIEYGLKKTGPSQRLQKRHQEYAKVIAGQQLALDIEGMANEAEWLSKEIDRLKRQARLRPSQQVRSELKHLHARVHILGETLYSLGQQLQSEGKRKLADEVMTLAGSVGQEEAVHYVAQREQLQNRRLNPKASTELADSAEASKAAKPDPITENKSQLIARLESAIAKGKLESATVLLKRFALEYPQSRQFAPLSQRLAEASSQRVGQLFTQGNAHYAAGQFEQAQAVWQEILSLEPSNVTAKNLLMRTEKVIKNLRLLSDPAPEALISDQ